MDSAPNQLCVKPVSTLILVHKNDSETEGHSSQGVSLSNYKKSMLNTILCDMPSFPAKNRSTALLYSKFLVKGLKEDKLSIVKKAMKKKQDITETGTHYRNQTAKSISSSNRGYTTNIQQINDDASIIQGRNTVDVVKTMKRASSANNFKYRKVQTVGNQNGMAKIMSQANFVKSSARERPSTAKARNINQSNIQVFNKGANFIRQRPTTAKQNFYESMRNTHQDNDQIQFFKQKHKDELLKVDENQTIDYVLRNKNNVSVYSKKSSSIYLTGANIDSLVSGRYRRKERQTVKTEKKIQSHEQQQQLKPQNAFNSDHKKVHQKKVKGIEDYLLFSNPQKFQIVSQQISKQQKKTQINTDENRQQLLSKDMDKKCREPEENMDEKSARACFEDYIKHCQILQCNIVNKINQENIKEVNRSTIDVWECKKLLELYEKLKNQQSQSLKKQIITQIRKITSNLMYFKSKPDQQIDSLFTIPFQIISIEEDTKIVSPNSNQYIYIILNGSVMVQSRTFVSQNDKMSGKVQSKISLYDGQIFGENQKSMKKHLTTVTTLQQCLFLRVRYSDYVSVFFQGTEVEQKLQVLKLVFRLELNEGILTEENLQMISLSLQKRRFPSRSLIFRQGEVFDQLIFVRKGKIAAINEYLLTQQKPQPLDMRQIDKNIRQERPKTAKTTKNRQSSPIKIQNDCLSLQNFRREILINYQVLKETASSKTYYQIHEHKQFVRGDSLNWQSICFTFQNKIQYELLDQNISSVFDLEGSDQTPQQQYSLMSKSDETQVYFLRKSAFQYLPNDIKRSMLKKGQKQKTQIQTKSIKQIKTWNNYKQKLCHQIVSGRKNRI